MREYTLGKKAAAVVIHQMLMIMTTIGLNASQYCMMNGYRDYANTFSIFFMIGLSGSFVALAYLTNITGRKSEDDPTIYYNWVDKIYSDVLFAGCMVLFIAMFALIGKVRQQEFDFSSLMITVVTLTYVTDLLFLIFYHSIIRKLKGNILVTHSLIYRVYDHVKSLFMGKENALKTRKMRESAEIKKAIEKIATGALDTRLNLEDFHGQERELAEAVNSIRDGLKDAIEARIKNERMKADLITNVSHDIKTPLTSIVNYVELLKRENLDNQNVQNYIRIIDDKAQRLKQLTEDLVEASKISSGNIKLDMQKIDLVELLYQTGGEFNERFEQRNLTIVTKIPSESIFVKADGRQLYRAIENLYTNAAKYAMEKTRVYVELTREGERAVFSIKNISENLISLKDDENVNDLTERFVRGESSRTTEGSGLGLSIAKNLTNLMGGTFEINVDGDLFIATISFIMV